MGLQRLIAPFITLLIGASTIFISYKNYQAQAAANPPNWRALELWSKLLTEAGGHQCVTRTRELTSDQRVVLENYRVFLKRASPNRNCVSWHRQQPCVQPAHEACALLREAHAHRYWGLGTLLPLDSVRPAVHLGAARRCSSGAHRRGHHRLPDWPVAGTTAAICLTLRSPARRGAPDCWRDRGGLPSVLQPAEPHYSRHYREQRVLYFWAIYGSGKGARDSTDAYSERLAAKTYADQLFLGQQGVRPPVPAQNMYMAGIQEIVDEYPRAQRQRDAAATTGSWKPPRVRTVSTGP